MDIYYLSKHLTFFTRLLTKVNNKLLKGGKRELIYIDQVINTAGDKSSQHPRLSGDLQPDSGVGCGGAGV